MKIAGLLLEGMALILSYAEMAFPLAPLAWAGENQRLLWSCESSQPFRKTRHEFVVGRRFALDLEPIATHPAKI